MSSQLKMAKIPFMIEFKAVPSRRFKWDFALVDVKLLIEVQGGVWINGGHNTGTGVTRDCEKLNLATLEGYHCMNFTGDMIKSGKALRWVQEFIEKYKL